VQGFDDHGFAQFPGANHSACRYMSNGDLKTYLRACRPSLPHPKKHLGAHEFVTLLLGVSDALGFMHKLRLLHRDVAARNVLVDERGLPHGAKLSDLGSAHNLVDRDYYRTTTLADLPVRWMPPETLKSGIFTVQGDAWSFGVLAFEVSAPCRKESLLKLQDRCISS
jgi:serine/threonine protein kinase